MVAGTAMGSAPIIIHLLNRQRYKRITWAAMHWLLASFKKSSRRLQIEDLILLIIRILILILLALALARPFLQESGVFLGGRSHVHRVVVLDTSFSMGYSPGGKEAFARAREAAVELTRPRGGTLSSGDAVTLIYASDQATARIKASTNLGEVYREVGAAELSHGASDPVRALTQALEMLDESDHPRKELFLITDLTRTGWLDPQARTQRVRGAEGLTKAAARYRKEHPGRELPPVFLIDVGVPDARNLAVTRLAADVNVVAAKSQVVFRAEISSFDGEDHPQLPVTFSVDGRRVSDRPVSLKAGERTSAMFFHQFETPGPHWVTVSTDPDQLRLDDSRHLAVPVVPSLKVLLVDGEEKADPFDSETGLLSRALSVPVSEQMAAEGMSSPSIINTQVIADSGLSDAQFEGLDMVVLANVAVIPEDKLSQLRRFVLEGGALAIFVGDSVGPDLYNERLFDAKDEAGKAVPPLLPCRLLEPEGEGGNPDAQKFFAFAPDDNIVNLLPTFAPGERRSYVARPEKKTPEIGVRVFRRYRVKMEDPAKKKAEPAEKTEPPAEKKDDGPAPGETDAAPAAPDPGGNGQRPAPAGSDSQVYVPLRYDDGEPAILVREYGLGKVCLVTTTADDYWTDLPHKLAFLPAMHDMVYALVRARGRKHNLRVGGAFSVKWPPEDLLKEVTVTPPEGHEEDKRTVKPQSREGVTMLTCEGARWAGAYRLTVVGEETPRAIFTSNVDPTESDLARIETEELARLVKDVKFEKIEDCEKIGEIIKARASGKEFWRNLTWAVLVLAVAETFLAWFFGRHRW
jgi:hypothetical protein